MAKVSDPKMIGFVEAIECFDSDQKFSRTFISLPPKKLKKARVKKSSNNKPESEQNLESKVAQMSKIELKNKIHRHLKFGYLLTF